jgi:putative SOS response-associated peptidase YedK
MCGRYARYQSLTSYLLALDAPSSPLYDLARERDDGARYNIAPGTNGWLLAFDQSGDLGLDERKWSFPTSRGPLINVRSETAHRVPEYRDHFDRHRCAVLASGFYEPKGAKTEKNRPWFFFRPKDKGPLFIGGILGPDGFSILTREPVKPVADVHDRSPVLVPVDNLLAFLDSEVPGQSALHEFAPPEFGRSLECRRVGDGAKRASNEGPELIERLQQNSGLFS